jgi:hypothetical protein
MSSMSADGETSEEAQPQGDSAALAFRAEQLASTPRWYRPGAHLVLPALFGIAIVSVAVSSVSALKPWQLVAVPVVVVVQNLAEWYTHKSVMHRPIRHLDAIYHGHTLVHHRAFTGRDMSIRDWRELRLILIPAHVFLLLVLIFLPIGAVLALVGQRNLAALYAIAVTSYTFSYEWLHVCFHLPADGLIGRRRFIRRLRRHHELHHGKDRMGRWNFNVVIPLWDRLLGTSWRGDPESAPPTLLSPRGR